MLTTTKTFEKRDISGPPLVYCFHASTSSKIWIRSPKMTTNHWHSPQLISQNRLSAILEIMRSIRVWKWGNSEHMDKRKRFIVFVVKQVASSTLRCRYDWQMKLIKRRACALGGKKISFKTCALSGPPLVCCSASELHIWDHVKLLYFADCKKEKKKSGKERVLRFYRNRNGK